MSHDDLFSKPLQYVSDFSFDEQVVRVFPDMIRRSVPGYEAAVAMLGGICEKYAQPNSSIYDLGCSLGAVTISAMHRIRDTSVRFIAIDNAPDMIARCRENIRLCGGENRVETRVADIRGITINNASVVIMHYTLQFTPPEDRYTVCQNIYQGMKKNAALIISEKIATSDAPILEILHNSFKSSNGYSELEISQKRTALENVMHVDTPRVIMERLRCCGFQEVSQWFQAMNFASFIAIK